MAVMSLIKVVTTLASLGRWLDIHLQVLPRIFKKLSMDTFTCWNILKTVHTRYFFCVLYTFARASKDHKNTLQKCGFLRTDAFLIWSLFSVIKTISTQEVSGSGDKPGSFLQASHFCIGVEGLLVHHHHCEITKCLWERSQRVIWEQLSATVLQGLCCPTGSAGKGRWRGQHGVKRLPQICDEFQPAGCFNLSSTVSSNPKKQTGACQEVQGEVQSFSELDSYILTLVPNAFLWYVLCFIRNSTYSKFPNLTLSSMLVWMGYSTERTFSDILWLSSRRM